MANQEPSSFASASASASDSARVYTEREIEAANILLLLHERTVVFLPPPERKEVVQKAPRSCTFCGRKGHNFATCAAAPCGRCGLSGHISRNCPDHKKGKKAKKGKKGKAKVEEETKIA